MNASIQDHIDAMDDAELGRMVKEQTRAIARVAQKNDRPLSAACALMLAGVVAESGAENMTTRLAGYSCNGKQFGDWTVTIERGLRKSLWRRLRDALFPPRRELTYYERRGA